MNLDVNIDLGSCAVAATVCLRVRDCHLTSGQDLNNDLEIIVKDDLFEEV